MPKSACATIRHQVLPVIGRNLSNRIIGVNDMMATKAVALQHVSAKTGDDNTERLRKTLLKNALPSNAELQHLHAENPSVSARSTLFCLQINSLLESVQQNRDDEYTNSLQSILFELKNVMESIEDQLVTAESLRFPGLVVLNHIGRKANILSFQKPSRIDIVGSYILKNMMKRPDNAVDIDVVVEMPKTCFVPKDFKDYRYANKRNMYLGVLIAKVEEQCDFVDKVQLASFRDQPDKPTAVLSVSKEALKLRKMQDNPVRIRLIPAITEDTFQLSKLSPLRYNVRIRENLTLEEVQKEKTPLYNNLILEDMMFRRHTREIHAAMKKSPAFTEACKLAKIWVQQRELDSQMDSLNGFLVSMLLLYLLTHNKIKANTASDHMFKILMQFIAKSDMRTRPLAFDIAEGGAQLIDDRAKTLCSTFDLVFLDSSGHYNLFGRVTASAWAEIKRESLISLHLMQSNALETFQSLFIHKRAFWARFDDYFWIPTTSLLQLDASDLTDAEQNQMNDKGCDRYWKDRIENIVTKALGDRAEIVRSFVRRSTHWDPSCPIMRRRKISIGIRINPQNAWRLVDRGPPSDDTEKCLQFRQFWKHKAELRRFKDGSIVESVVWDADNEHAKSQILNRIVKYIITAHLTSIHIDSIRSSSEVISATSRCDNLIDQASRSDLRYAFNKLCKMLHELKSLPLKISNVVPVHPSFRGTNSIPVDAHPLAFSKLDKKVPMPTSHVSTIIHPLTAYIRFEKSNSWPKEYEALLHCKSGFYVHIARELKKQFLLNFVVSTKSLDVLFEGYAFRLVIHSERDLTALAATPALQNTHARNKLVKAKRKVDYLVCHANKVDALQTQYSSFGPTVRSLHRWIAAKCLSNFFTIEILELLVTHVYTNTNSASQPNSILSGLLESFRLIAYHSWELLPLIIDFDGTMDEEKRREILKRFEASQSSRSSHPSMYIASDYEDMESLSCWTREQPSRVILKRLQDLARLSHKCLLQWLSSGIRGPGLDEALSSSFTDFDAVIRMNASILPAKQTRLDGPTTSFSAAAYKNLDLSTIPIMVGFDPVRSFLKDLVARYDVIALFFINHLENDAIYITWKPTAFVPVKFRAIASTALIPLPATIDKSKLTNFVQDRTYAVPNTFQILSEMRELGADMIRSVELCTN